MKKLFYLFIILILSVSWTANKAGIEVSVENLTNIDRTEEIVGIPVSAIEAKLKLKEGMVYAVKNQAGEVITSQITSDAKLIFPVKMKANSTEKFQIEEAAPQTFAPKTFGRYIPERKEDFAWENDRVAFRVYGNELIATDGPSNGIDLWYKRTNDIVIDKWYKDDIAQVASYHKDHGEGLDDYKVGRSLGAGAMAPFVDETLILNSNYVSYEVLDNGPLRTTFKVVYNDLDVNGTKLKESRTFSIDAGSQYTKVTQSYEGLTSPMDVAAGYPIHGEKPSTVVSPDNNFIIESEPVNPQVGAVYLGLIFPDKFTKTVENTYTIVNEISKKEQIYSHILAVNLYQPNSPVTYYTGYGWEKFGFPTVNDFEAYTKLFIDQLANPLKINY